MLTVKIALSTIKLEFGINNVANKMFSFASCMVIVSGGITREEVLRITRLIDSSEYKRRQAPPGIKITPRAFGRDRRMPITNRFRESG